MVQGSPSRWIVHDPGWMNFTMVFSRHRSRYPGTGVLDAVTDTAQQCGAHALRAVWCSRPVGIQPTTKPYLSFFYPVPSIPRTRIIAADLEGTIWVFCQILCLPAVMYVPTPPEIHGQLTRTSHVSK